MRDKYKYPRKSDKGRFTDKQLSRQKYAGKLTSLNDLRHLAIQSLLKTAPASVDDKLAMVKTAHYVDKDRFQNALRKLMGSSKSRSS